MQKRKKITNTQKRENPNNKKRIFFKEGDRGTKSLFVSAVKSKLKIESYEDAEKLFELQSGNYKEYGIGITPEINPRGIIVTKNFSITSQ